MIMIKQATKEGCIAMEEGGVFDASFPESSTRRGRVQEGGTVSPTLTAQNNELYRVEKIVCEERSDEGLRTFTEECCGALRTIDSGGDKRIVEIKKPLKVGNVSTGNSEGGCVYSDEGVSQTITAGTHGYGMGNIMTEYRIRKLTPKECFRLMGVDDEDADKMIAVNSNTQCYKQAGNSIVVDVMAAMFAKLF